MVAFYLRSMTDYTVRAFWKVDIFIDMAEEQYSVELEKLLHDLKVRPDKLSSEPAELRSRIQMLRAPERAIWFEKLEEHGVEQEKKLDKPIHRNN